MDPIVKAVRAYTRGIFCPAEMWNQIADALGTGDVFTTFDALPVDTQRDLLACYRDRPGSLMTLADRNPLHAEAERWCRERMAGE